jgi:hypothetical protein
VNVVLLDVQLDNFPVFPLADRLENSPQFTFDLLRPEDFSAILGCPDEMVLQVVKAV